MESDKPDLNSILESARAQLEMYRRASQEELNEPTKEIILARSKDQVMEDVSGPLFERNRESGVECSRAASGKSVASRKSCEPSKETKDSRANSEIETEGVDVEGEESSNKNFDSSTMTLGDQGSFQNQAELTSQTTYTNIHELTGPVKDDILVVTSEVSEPIDKVDPPSQVSQNVQETSSDTATLNITTSSNITAADDDISKEEESNHNQMAFIRGWKSDPCRDTRQETIVTETFPRENAKEEAVDKGDAAQAAGAGTREGSPIRTDAKLIQEVAQSLSQLEVKGNQCSWVEPNIAGQGSNPIRENELSKDSTNTSSEDFSVKTERKDEIESRGFSIFDNPSVPPNLLIQNNTVDNKQVDFVEHFKENEIGKIDANIGKVSDKSMFEDEGFVDSKDLTDSTKIIFITDQEDEQSCKPFETEDDNSCLLEPSSAGRSLELQSDLEAKPSLTDVHPLDQGRLHDIIGEADADSNRIISLEALGSNTNEDKPEDEEVADTHQENVVQSPEKQKETALFDDVGKLTPFDPLKSSITTPNENKLDISSDNEAQILASVNSNQEGTPTIKETPLKSAETKHSQNLSQENNNFIQIITENVLSYSSPDPSTKSSLGDTPSPKKLSDNIISVITPLDTTLSTKGDVGKISSGKTPKKGNNTHLPVTPAKTSDSASRKPSSGKTPSPETHSTKLSSVKTHSNETPSPKPSSAKTPSPRPSSAKTLSTETPSPKSSSGKTPSTETHSTKPSSAKTPSTEAHSPKHSSGKTPTETSLPKTPLSKSSVKTPTKQSSGKITSTETTLAKTSNKSSPTKTSPAKTSPTKTASSKTPPSTPRVVKVHSKTETPEEQTVPTKQPKCIGRAIFEMFFKSMSEGKSPLPPHLTAILQNAYAPEEQPQLACVTTVPVLKESHSGSDYESAYEGSDKNLNPNDSSVISKDRSSNKSDVVQSPSTAVTIDPISVKSIEKPIIDSPVNKPSTPPLHFDSNDPVTVVNTITPTDLKIHPSIPITPISLLQTENVIDALQIPNDRESVPLQANHNSPSNSSVHGNIPSLNDLQMNVNSESSNAPRAKDVDQVVPLVPPREIKLIPTVTEPEIQEVPLICEKETGELPQVNETEAGELPLVNETDACEPNPDLQEVPQITTQETSEASQVTELENREASLITQQYIQEVIGITEQEIQENPLVQEVNLSSGPKIDQLNSEPLLSSFIRTNSDRTKDSMISQPSESNHIDSRVISISIKDEETLSELGNSPLNDGSVQDSTNVGTSELLNDYSDENADNIPSTKILPENPLPKLTDLIIDGEEVMENNKEYTPDTNLTGIYPQTIPPPLPSRLKPTSNLSVEEERPLTPYVSEIRAPIPDINNYIQEPQIPNIKPPSPIGSDFRVRTPGRIDEPSVPPVKTPPRPPPRARQTVQPKKKKLNFFKKLFGVKTKSSN